MNLYLKYAGNNEAPEIFHWWTGVTIAGSVLRRQIYHPMGRETLYPNLWTMLVSESGSGKTIAANMGRFLLTRLEHIKVLADRLTAAQMICALGRSRETGKAADAQALIFAPELSAFLGRKDCAADIMDLLTRFYDDPNYWRDETKGAGETELKNMALCFLGCSAPDVMYDCIPSIRLKSGFLARFLCVYVDEKTAKAVPHMSVDVVAEADVVKGLQDISFSFAGEPREFPMPIGPTNWYSNWYFRYKSKIGAEPNLRMRAYLNRKRAFLLKIGMILSVASGSKEFTIPALEEAEVRLDELESTLPELYQDLGATPIGRFASNIVNQVRAAGEVGLTHDELLRQNFKTIADEKLLQKIVEMLVRAQQLMLGNRNGVPVYLDPRLRRKKKKEVKIET